MSDSELRDDLRALVVAGHHLYEGLTENGVSKLLEDDVRTDLDHIVSSLQSASERVIRPQRSTRLAAWMIGGTLIGGAVAGLLIYPGTRKPILRSLGLSDGDPWIDTASDNGGLTDQADRAGAVSPFPLLPGDGVEPYGVVEMAPQPAQPLYSGLLVGGAPPDDPVAAEQLAGRHRRVTHDDQLVVGRQLMQDTVGRERASG